MVVEGTGYELLEPIGHGGMGHVYRARDRRSGRDVAVKTLRADVRNDPARRRALVDEAIASARLHHPNVVDLLDVGVDDSGAPFLVMELMSGGPLSAWRDRWPGWPAVAHAFDGMLAALQAAHAAGIIHRDLKPENVLLAAPVTAGATVDVKIADFGIARVLDPRRDTASDGRLVGTPEYMAPEQLGGTGAIGPWTDLYALGSMLYEFLTGAVPFGSAPLMSMLSSKVHELPSVPRLRSGLYAPPELLKLTMALLQSRPHGRPRFAADVRRILSDCSGSVRNEVSSRVARVETATDPTGELPTRHVGTMATALDSADDNRTTTEKGTTETTWSATHAPPTLRTEGASPDVTMGRLRETPFVGRRAECAQLVAAMVRVRDTRLPSMVMYVGEPGLGKSRLAHWGLSEVERRGWMEGIAAGYDAAGTGSVGGLRHALLRLLGPCAESLSSRSLPPAWEWMPIQDARERSALESLAPWIAGTAQNLATSDVASHAHVALRVASRIRPIYFWLDDAAWSRDGALELAEIVLTAGPCAVLLVGTIRSRVCEQPATSARLERLLSHPRLETCTPASLDVTERIELLRELAHFAPGVVEQIARGIEPTPLLIAQRVDAWRESHLLRSSSDGLALADGVSLEQLLGASVGQNALTDRLDGLLSDFGDKRADAEHVLWRAALLGQRFEEHALRSVSRARPEIVDIVVDRALLHGVLRVDGPGAYRFDHNLLSAELERRARESANRADVLRDVARALRDVYGDRRSAVALRIASLRQLAGDLADAIRDLTAAARAAARDGEWGLSQECCVLGSSWLDAASVPADDVLRAHVRFAEANLHYYRSEYPAALDALDFAEPIYARTAARTDHTQARLVRSSVYFYQERVAESAAIARECLAHATMDDPERAEIGARAESRLMTLAFIDSRNDDALVHARQGEAFARSSSDSRTRCVLVSNHAELLLAMGQPVDAARVLATITEGPEPLTEDDMGSDLAEIRSRVAIGLGQLALARELVDRCLSDATVADDAWRRTMARVSLVRLALAEARSDDIRAATTGLLEAYRAVPVDDPYTWGTIEMAAEYCQRCGHVDLAATLTELVRSRRERMRSLSSVTLGRTRDDA